MSKKEKQNATRRDPTKRQLSKWQRQQKTSRIIIIAIAVFLAGIIGYTGYGYYNDNIKPFKQVAIEVNDVSFDMGYYVDMLDIQTRSTNPTEFHAQYVSNQIEQMELMKQGAGDMGIEVEDEEVKAKIKELDLPDNRAYRDLVIADLLQQEVLTHFTSQLPQEIEQANIRTILVESQEVASEVQASLQEDEDFNSLLEEFSCNSNASGEMGWLPPEMMPSAIGAVFPSFEAGEITTINDSNISKDIGYWIIKVSDKDDEKGIFAHTILLPSMAKAMEIIEKLEDGGDFAELAKEYSQDASKENGGELGWITEGYSGSEAFDEAAFNLDLDTVSAPVRDDGISTQGGCWVIEVLDKGQHELDDSVKETLAGEDFNLWLSQLEESSTINNYLDEEMMAWAIEEVLERR